MRYSIITVCYNESDRIARTAESVISQTFSDYEWIVKDGASTDGTTEILETFRDRMAYWVSARDAGIYDAMNEGARAARGQWLLFLNGGDALADSRALERMAGLMDDVGEEIVVGSHVSVWPDQNRAVNRKPGGLKNANRELSCHQLYHRTVNHQSAFIGRRVFEDFGPYDTSFRVRGDYDFFIRACLGGVTIRCVEPVVVEYDMSGISTTQKGSWLMKWEGFRARSHYSKAYRLRRYVGSLRRKEIIKALCRRHDG